MKHHVVLTDGVCVHYPKQHSSQCQTVFLYLSSLLAGETMATGKWLIDKDPHFSSLHFHSEFLDINFSHITCSPVPRSFAKPLLFSVSGVKLVHSPIFECIWKMKTFYCPSRRGTVPFGSISSFCLFLFENVQSHTIYPFRKAFFLI